MSPKPSTTTARKSKKLPIILMAWPLAGMLLSVLGYMVANALFSAVAPGGDDLFGQSSPLQSFFSVVAFVLGGASILLGPISFVIGLVLILTNNKK